MNEKLLKDIIRINGYYNTNKTESSQWNSYQLQTILKLSEAIIVLNEEIKEIRNDSKNAEIN